MSESNGFNLKAVLLGLSGLTVVTLIGLYLGFGPRWYRGYQPAQPIPFSHSVHAGAYKIPCLYCHGSAEYSSFSEVPGLETCMTCHSQVAKESPWIKKLTAHWESKTPVPWVKVHVLPDFVQFNHRAHVAAGVECQNCHGPVEEMAVVYQWADMNMGWCVDCHRNDQFVSAPRKWFLEARLEMQGGKKPWWYELVGQKQVHNADVSCSTCHY